MRHSKSYLQCKQETTISYFCWQIWGKNSEIDILLLSFLPEK